MARRSILAWALVVSVIAAVPTAQATAQVVPLWSLTPISPSTPPADIVGMPSARVLDGAATGIGGAGAIDGPLGQVGQALNAIEAEIPSSNGLSAGVSKITGPAASEAGLALGDATGKAAGAGAPVLLPLASVTSSTSNQVLVPSCNSASDAVQPARDALHWNGAENICPLFEHGHGSGAKVTSGTGSVPSLSEVPPGAPAYAAVASPSLTSSANLGAVPPAASGAAVGATEIQTQAAGNLSFRDDMLAGGLLGAAIIGALALALYRRILAREVLGQETRKRAYDAVLRSPGITIGGVARELGLDYRVAAHHLRILQEFHLIEARQLGAWFRYYKNGGSYSEEAKLRCVALASPKARSVQSALASLPAGTLADLSRATGLPKSTVKWHRDRLAAMGALAP